jgi:hypothetical protein
MLKDLSIRDDLTQEEKDQMLEASVKASSDTATRAGSR